jgi:hypothetical protein
MLLLKLLWDQYNEIRVCVLDVCSLITLRLLYMELKGES